MEVTSNQPQEENDPDKSVLEIARNRFQIGIDAEKDHREVGLEDLQFRAGEQWHEQDKQQRKSERRPCLTINKIPGFVHQITNDQRQNRTSVKVNPVDDHADIETAEVLQGLMRHIEYNSKADAAFDTSFEGAVVPGRGFHRVVTDYCDPLSFDQEILIKRIPNSFSVVVDPYYQEPDGSDINWGFIFQDFSKDDYKAQYPNSKLAGEVNWESFGDTPGGWMSGNSCRVAEYFTKTWKETKIYQLPDGMVVEEKDLKELAAVKGQLKSRDAVLPAIKHYKLNGIEILEQTDWKGRWIPIIPVHGDELNVDGKRIFEGIVRHVKDSQRMYNYTATSEAEAIGLAPKAPWVGAEGQFDGHEHEWNNAHLKNFATLEYKPTTHEGLLVPPPKRNFGEPAVQALTQARMLSADDIKATSGVYDASMGNKSNEVSGRAIRSRTAQAQTTNFHFSDNLSRSKRHTWNIVLDLSPHIYDAERALRIISPEGEHKVVWIQRAFKDEKTKQERTYDFGVGKYDITLSEGPSDTTKRQEAVESILEFVRVYPAAAPVIGDLLAKNMDWPGAQEISDRLKKLLPPDIGDDEEKQKQPIPPQVQQQLQQMGALIEQLTGALNNANHAAEMKEAELESKERIAIEKNRTDLIKEEMKLGSTESIALLRAELAQMSERLNILDANEPIELNPQEMSEASQFGVSDTAEPLPEYQPDALSGGGQGGMDVY